MIFAMSAMPEYIAMSVVIFSMIAAVFMDIRKQEVYDLVWVLMLAAGTALYFCRCDFSIIVIISLCFYFVFQEKVMPHFYGKADCHAFCACSLTFAAFGRELEYYALHMTVTWLILAVFQLAGKNVTRCGKLRKPVPMIPYIAAGFFIVLVIP